jgi:carbonic anhydrase
MRLYRSIILSLLVLLPLLVLAAGGSYSHTPQDILNQLKSGNERFVADKPAPWHADGVLRASLAPGQHPLACVITCADSRVSPELLFDQSLGDLFVCRVAGNVVTPEITGSVDYAVEHLSVPLVIVLGHTKCGAVNATIANPEMTGPIGSIVSRIAPCVSSCLQNHVTGDELLNCAVSTNANMGCVSLLQNSTVVQAAVKSGHCMLVSAVYDITTGNVEWETQLAAVNLSSSHTEQAPAAQVTAPATTETSRTEKQETTATKTDQTSASRQDTRPPLPPRRH